MAELVGILNVTPDSTSDGGKYYEPGIALEHAEKLFADGAALLDVGAESTRPGATPLDQTTEQWRLNRVLPKLVDKYPGKISLDTYKPETAKWALEEFGDLIINDVTGMNNPKMVDTIANYQARCIISHMHGTDIQAAHRAKLINEPNAVIYDLRAKAELLVDRGVKPDKIILDPGLGFGKTPELNKKLLGVAADLPDYPVMVGYSHKRFIATQLTEKEGADRRDTRLNLDAGRIAVGFGADYLRVHDVAAHQQLLY